MIDEAVRLWAGIVWSREGEEGHAEVEKLRKEAEESRLMREVEHHASPSIQHEKGKK